MKVKLLHGPFRQESRIDRPHPWIEDQINTWLEEHPDFRVIDIKISAFNAAGVVAMILYEKPETTEEIPYFGIIGSAKIGGDR